MKILKIILQSVLVLILLFNVYILSSGDTFIYKALRYNFVDIDDYHLFENRKLPKSNSPKPWLLSKNYNKILLTDTLTQTHQSLGSTAFLVIKNDSILIEKYWGGYEKDSISNSFSMAKSVVSLLVGVAIKEGKIKSIEQPVKDFLPEFGSGDKSKITIKHLLTMSSGLDWVESNSYKNPVAVFFSDIMEGYYGDDVSKLAASKAAKEPAGQYFDYKSGDTQLLASILEIATGQSLSDYAAQKIWQPLGSENDALWSLDQKAHEKAFCCLSATATDFARLGRLILNQGKHDNIQIIDSAYLNESTRPCGLKDKNNLSLKPDFYGYQIWLLPDYNNQNIVYLRGTLGQLIIINRSKNIIIVRLGHKSGDKIGAHYGQTLLYIDQINKLLGI